MSSIGSLKREFAARAKDQAKLEKRIRAKTLVENLEFVPYIIANDNNLLEVLGGNSKRELKKIFSDVIKSVEFYNLIKLSVDSLVNSDAANNFSNSIIRNAYDESNYTHDHANYGTEDTTNY